jgi:hypothetical protein
VDSFLDYGIIKSNRSLYGDGSRTVKEAYEAMGKSMSDYDAYAADIKSVTPNLASPAQIVPTGKGHVAGGGHHHHAKGEAHAQGVALKEGMHGQDVQALQNQLIALGYKGSNGQPLTADGQFDSNTKTAVEAFQRDNHISVDGVVGDGTTAALEKKTKALSLPATSLYDPRNPDSPHNDLFNILKDRIPDASENRLLQFTAACQGVGITGQNLDKILIGDRGLVGLSSGGLMPEMAVVDIKQPSPSADQSIQQIQQNTQHQQAIQAQVQVQQVQVNQQQQGPVMGY